jgi:hypothetical protein
LAIKPQQGKSLKINDLLTFINEAIALPEARHFSLDVEKFIESENGARLVIFPSELIYFENWKRGRESPYIRLAV